MSEDKRSLMVAMSDRYGVPYNKLQSALQKIWTAAKDEQSLIAMCIVAYQYGLNPFTNEIYSFVNKKTGCVVPIVGIDGWIRLINEHPQYDGMEVTVSEDGQEATCTIWRKDRSRPTVVTEYKRECFRSDSDAWQKFPLRMLRHRAIAQCARIAFGFSGIYDPDEASTFAEPVKQSGVEKQVDELTTRLQDKLDEQEQEQQPESEVIDAEFTTEEVFIDNTENEQ